MTRPTSAATRDLRDSAETHRVGCGSARGVDALVMPMRGPTRGAPAAGCRRRRCGSRPTRHVRSVPLSARPIAERLAHLAGPVRQVALSTAPRRVAHRSSSPSTRLDSPDEHRRPSPSAPIDHVGARVDAVAEVHVQHARAGRTSPHSAACGRRRSDSPDRRCGTPRSRRCGRVTPPARRLGRRRAACSAGPRRRRSASRSNHDRGAVREPSDAEPRALVGEHRPIRLELQPAARRARRRRATCASARRHPGRPAPPHRDRAPDRRRRDH